MTDTRPAFPYEIQLTAHEREHSRVETHDHHLGGSRREGLRLGERRILQIQDRTRSASAGGPMPLVIQAILIAMWLNRRLAVIEVVVSECEAL